MLSALPHHSRLLVPNTLLANALDAGGGTGPDRVGAVLARKPDMRGAA
jgi:hypothetical protein